TEDLDAYDSDCDDVSNAKAVLMANLSNYGSDVISEKAQRIKATLYDGSFISSQHAASLVIDGEETLILEEVSRSKRLAKQNDQCQKKKKVKTTPINNVELNRLFEDFGKRFVPQLELSDEQALWLQTSHPNTNQSASSLVKVEAPRELPKCLDLDAELLNKQNAYNDLSKSYSQLKKHCIYLELTMQLNQEIFQKDSSSDNQNALEILEYFKNNDLKAQLQAKDTTICKLKKHIKSIKENTKEENVKQDMDEIETINIELEHCVARLLSENERLNKEIEHLKKNYKDQFDSIKKTRALSKEHYDSLIAQLNSKSMENADLNGQIQEKVFMTTALQNELKRLKGLKSSTSASRSQPTVAVAPRAVEIAATPSSTTVDQDVPSSSTSSTNQQQQSSIISQGVEEPIPNALFDDACHEPLHDVSTSQKSTMTTTAAQQVALDNALICPRLPNKDFDELPLDDEIVSFIKELGHKRDIKYVTKVVVDQMYQPWRTFAATINKFLSGKITGLDKLRLSRAQIL
nr:pyruvate, phosphate dikinase regulatory protein, chloroplastic [Tanacetum cinerariifolium]